MATAKIDLELVVEDKATRTLEITARAVGNVEGKVKDLDKAMDATAKSTPSLNQVLEQQTNINGRLSKGIERTGQSVLSLGKYIDMLSGPLAGAAMAGMKLHSDFVNGMAKVSTLVDTSLVSIQKLSQGIREISDETGVSVTDLAEAEYSAISAGVDAANVTEFLRTATLASKAGFTDSATAIDGLTGVINAYGMSADKAMDIANQMLMTQNFGKTTFGEMSQTMGQVIPVAATLGVSTQDLFTSIAVLTKQTIKTPEAMTALKAAYSNILKPSTQAAKAAASIGLEFNAAHLKSVGWARFLDEVKEKTGGDTELMGQLFGSTEALNGILALTSQTGAQQFKEGLDMITNSSGATEEAFYKLLTPSQQNEIALNQLRNAGMDLAEGLTPILKGTAGLVKDFAAWLKGLSPEQKAFIEDIGKVIVVAGILVPVLGGTIIAFGKFYGVVSSGVAAVVKHHGVMAALAERFKDTIAVAKGARDQFGLLRTVFTSSCAAGGVFAKAMATVTAPIRSIGQLTTSLGTRLAGMAGGFMGIFQKMGAAVLWPLRNINNLSDAFLRLGYRINGSMTGLAGTVRGALGGAINAARAAITSGLGSIRAALSGGAGMARALFTGLSTVIRSPLTALNILRSGAVTAFRAIALAARGLMLNPLGIGIMVLVGLGLLLYKNWDTVKNSLVRTFNIMREAARPVVEALRAQFAGVFANLSSVFGRFLNLVKIVWAGISSAFGGGEGKVAQVVGIIMNLVGGVLVTAFRLALNTVSTVISAIGVVLNGIITVIGGIIDFLMGVFTGNWSAAWQGIVEIFSGIFGTITGICETVLQGVKGAINAVIGGINSLNVTIPDWVPGVGGNTFAPNIPYLARGTDNWPGGPAVINDAGPEIVELPQGTRVVPHDKSMKEEYARGQRDGQRALPQSAEAATRTGGNITISIAKLAESIVVHDKQDIDDLARTIATRVEQVLANRMQGAVV